MHCLAFTRRLFPNHQLSGHGDWLEKLPEKPIFLDKPLPPFVVNLADVVPFCLRPISGSINFPCLDTGAYTDVSDLTGTFIINDSVIIIIIIITMNLFIKIGLKFTLMPGRL